MPLQSEECARISVHEEDPIYGIPLAKVLGAVHARGFDTIVVRTCDLYDPYAS